jgi:transcriptional regulator with XRE-family HTH domain
MSRAVPLTDQVRRAIDASGMSQIEICKATGIDKATMSRVMTGKQWLHVRGMNAIGKLLGLEIVASKSARKRAQDRDKN